LPKRIIILNQKGGVGKTTTVINISFSFAYLGKRVLLVDIDPQANATSSFGIDKRRTNPNIYEVIIGKTKVDDAIKQTNISGLSIVPSNISLAGARVELGSLPNRERRLKDALSCISDYDYIFIDPPPSIGIITLNGLVAADSVIIPINISYYAMEGIVELLSLISKVKRNLNPSLFLEGVLVCMFDARTRLSFDIYNEIRGYFKEKVYRTIIPYNVRLAEAPSHNLPCYLYDKNSRGAIAYIELAKEICSK